MKNMDKVYDFSVSNAGDVVLMTHSDFYQFESGLSKGKTSKYSRPLLRDVSVAEFRKGSYNMFYKLHNDEQLREADFLKKKQNLSFRKYLHIRKQIEELHLKRRMVYCGIFPPEIFYENLPVDEHVVDLVKERE